MRQGIFDAVKAGDTEAVKSLITEGTDLNMAESLLGNTPLHCAALSGDSKMVEILLTGGARKDIRNSQGLTPIQLAMSWWAAHRSDDVMKLLIDHHSLDDLKVAGGDELLHSASMLSLSNFAGYLIEKGVEVNARGKEGLTPLHQAARSGSLAVAELLLQKGAHVNAHDDSGCTPLFIAAVQGHGDMITHLLAHSADVSACDRTGRAPIHLAAPSVIMLLLDAGSPIDCRDGEGETPLIKAAREGWSKNLSILLSRGADVNLKDNRGMSALHYAVTHSTHHVPQLGMDMATLLISRGVPVNAGNIKGETPLSLVRKAALNPKLKQMLAQLLKTHGAKEEPFIQRFFSRE